MSEFMETEEITRQRHKNRETVERYFTCRGLERGRGRLPLWSEKEVFFEIPWTASGKPRQYIGRKVLEDKENDFNVQNYPDWGFYDQVIYETQNPDFFVAECSGKGYRVLDGKRAYYKNHYLLTFCLKDGKIVKLQEINNQCNASLCQGHSIPQYPWYE